jgi:hypothetical protein
MAVWGDLYKNPFTGGFFTVPQNAIYQATRDLALAHDYVDRQLSSFLARDNGTHLYETLKLLNWLSVPADRWHPAIRGEPTDHWINVLSLRELDDVASLGQLDATGRVASGYAEVRVFVPETVEELGNQVEKEARDQATQAVDTLVDPGVVRVASAREGVSMVAPRLTKLDLASFRPAREAYDTLSWEEKLLRHSWLLDLGVMLCEPSIRFEGMGGECIWGCACWVVVPHAAIRGEVERPVVTG